MHANSFTLKKIQRKQKDRLMTQYTRKAFEYMNHLLAGFAEFSFNSNSVTYNLDLFGRYQNNTRLEPASTLLLSTTIH